MSLSNSRLSYADCFALLEQALDEPRGIRVEVADEAAATYLRLRIHHARVIDRAENAKIYPDPDHYLHGRSIYDCFVCRIEAKPGEAWLWLDKQKVELGRIESIPEGARLVDGPKPMLQLAPPDLPIVMPIQAQIRRR